MIFVFHGPVVATLPRAFAALVSSSHSALEAVIASCVFGVAISYFGMNARKLLQATAFSVLGVVCKFATIVVNTLIWDRHASATGILFMILSLIGGVLYQQLMQNKAVTVEKPKPIEHGIEQQPLNRGIDNSDDLESN